MPTPEYVRALAERAGVELAPERCKILAAALEAFEPFLDTLGGVETGGEEPPPVFDARW